MNITDTYGDNETVIAIAGATEEIEKDSEKEALERWWAELNTADDNFAIHISRKIPNTAKNEQCFSESVSDTNLTDIINKCRAEYIPIGERASEFVLKFQNKKTGKFQGQKNLCITRKNSDLDKNNIGSESQLASVMHDLMQRQQASNEQMLGKIIESQNQAKSNGVSEFFQSPAGLALITALAPTIVTLLKPKEAANPNQSMKDTMETMLLMKQFFDPKDEDDKEEGLMSVVNQAIKTMGGPLAEGAMALAKQPKLPPPLQNKQLDQAIVKENEKRSVEATTMKGEAFLKHLISVAMGGARNNAPVDLYSTVILDQVPDENLDEFGRFMNDANALTVINHLVPETHEYNDWFASLISHLKVDILTLYAESENIDGEKDETSQNIDTLEGELTNAESDVIMTDSQLVDEDANASTSDSHIADDSERTTGDEGDTTSNEPLC